MYILDISRHARRLTLCARAPGGSSQQSMSTAQRIFRPDAGAELHQLWLRTQAKNTGTLGTSQIGKLLEQDHAKVKKNNMFLLLFLLADKLSPLLR